MKDLQEAKRDIEKALELKRIEKIFQAEPGIQKILNIANAEEAYVEQAHYVQKRIKERREFELDNLKCRKTV